MTSVPSTPIDDDHHDELSAPRSGRTHAAYLQKVNSLVQSGRESLAYELSDAFVEETSGAGFHRHPGRRSAGRRTPTRSGSGRPRSQAATRLGRIGRFTRSSLERFDRYTLDVFNPGSPNRSGEDSSV